MEDYRRANIYWFHRFIKRDPASADSQRLGLIRIGERTGFYESYIVVHWNTVMAMTEIQVVKVPVQMFPVLRYR